MKLFHCGRTSKYGIDGQLTLRIIVPVRRLPMKKGKLFAIASLAALFTVAVANDNASAQTLASNNPTKTEKPSKTSANKLNAPVVHEFQGDGRAMFSSSDGHIAVHIYHAKDDP